MRFSVSNGLYGKRSPFHVDATESAHGPRAWILRNAGKGDVEVRRRELHEIVQEGLNAAQGGGAQVARMDYQHPHRSSHCGSVGSASGAAA